MKRIVDLLILLAVWLPGTAHAAPQVVIADATPEQEQIIRDSWQLVLDTYSHAGCNTPKGIKVKVVSNYPYGAAAIYLSPDTTGAKAKVRVNEHYVQDWVLVHEYGHHWDWLCLTYEDRAWYAYHATGHGLGGPYCWGCGATHDETPAEIWADDFAALAGVEMVDPASSTAEAQAFLWSLIAL